MTRSVGLSPAFSRSGTSAASGAVDVATVHGLGGDPGAVVVTSLRSPDRPGEGNVSLVVGEGDAVAARAALLDAAGVGLDRGVAMEQVHGGDVAVVTAADAGAGMRDHGRAVPGVDALVTFEPDLALLVMTADCVPVLLIDPGRGVAAVHAGRRGVMADVLGAALAALGPRAAGGVTAVVGPAIGGCCYEVPADMAAEVVAAHPEAAARTRRGTPALDLPAAVTARLGGLGLGRIARWPGCTACDGERWFSHRRDPGRGRQGAVVVRRSAPPVDGAPAGPDSAAFLDWVSPGDRVSPGDGRT